MNQLRIVFFGSGSPASCVTLQHLFDVADVVAVVLPRKHARADALWTIAVDKKVPVLNYADPGQLRALDADLFCVGTFPHILDQALLSLPRLGVVNVHPSLLPRHRGPDPIFWTYFLNEPETGVTVHWMSEQVDAGDIILQARVPIPRGLSGVTLYMQLAGAGARLLADAVMQITNRTATRVPQDERIATSEPSPAKRTWNIPYEEWTAERLWHFLRGIEHLRLPVPGKGMPVEDFEIVQHAHTPGTVTRENKRLILYTRDGRVRFQVRSRRSRIGRWMRRVVSRFGVVLPVVR